MELSGPDTNPGSTNPALLSMSLPHKLPDGPHSPPDSTVNALSSPEKPLSEKPPPHSNSVSSTVETPATLTSDVPKTSEASAIEQEGDEDVADSNSESDSEEPTFKRGRPGNPGMWKPEQVVYLKKYLPAYNALGSNSRARAEFFVNLLPDFLVKFPREQYPPPEPSRVAKAFRPLSEEKVNAMQSEDRKAYKKREKRALRSDDDRWFNGQQQHKNLKSCNPLKSHYKLLGAKKEAPKKSSLAQFVLKHEDYKDEVAERSEETGSHDWLASCVKAAQDITRTGCDFAMYREPAPVSEINHLLSELCSGHPESFQNR
ncbi:hypothetical protein V5O48_006986 [Marasmius crinis-equi]|uniref:Uncharacterized protein n=1 Tax=Marasmius crinis-equi TaxID=585013 RepID=A0ABR3FI67_9AGAR